MNWTRGRPGEQQSQESLIDISHRSTNKSDSNQLMNWVRSRPHHSPITAPSRPPAQDRRQGQDMTTQIEVSRESNDHYLHHPRPRCDFLQQQRPCGPRCSPAVDSLVISVPTVSITSTGRTGERDRLLYRGIRTERRRGKGDIKLSTVIRCPAAETQRQVFISVSNPH
ncbi:hypothetical protein ElyMa_002123600 [Elysia marginata]|uniref:Uncharacterized protein n=1 Tax=Elysia marginata TaxID=1093978 RepID=A0AAV4FJK0_9GAST|nr:hypothetical protein ElyMa_002123600 [Elysia marginata]